MVDNNRIFLVDFGIARLFTGGKIHDTIIIGTPGYASPEHHGKRETDCRSDIYSLGATLHYLFSGIDPADRPFVFKKLSETNKDIPEKLSEAVMKALSLDPDERFQTAGEMKDYFEKEVLCLLKNKSSENNHHTKPTLENNNTSTKQLQDILPKTEIPYHPPFYGEETFTINPLNVYFYPTVYSGGAISAAAIILSGGTLTLPVIALSTLMIIPGAYIARQLSKHINKYPESINVRVNNEGLALSQGKRYIRISWDDVIGFLCFQEKSKIGLPVNKYKLFTRKGDIEFDDQIKNVKRFNDIIITHAGLALAGESGGYRRYVRVAIR
jgi:serine/threonine protein kinase